VGIVPGVELHGDQEELRRERQEPGCAVVCEREFFIDNLLVRIHYIIEMIKWTGLAPSEF